MKKRSKILFMTILFNFLFSFLGMIILGIAISLPSRPGQEPLLLTIEKSAFYGVLFFFVFGIISIPATYGIVVLFLKKTGRYPAKGA